MSQSRFQRVLRQLDTDNLESLFWKHHGWFACAVFVAGCFYFIVGAFK